MVYLENTAVFIDNGYLQVIARHFAKKDYDINQFAITLSKEQKLWCEKVYFYIAPPYQSNKPTEDEKMRKAKYDRFVSALKKIPTITIREGRCQKKEDGEYGQKGVDTLIVMDLVQYSINHKKNKSLIIVTADTDFVPVLNSLRERGINIILYYYTDLKRNSKFSMSNHLSKACDKQILITPEHFDKSKLSKNNNYSK